MGNELREVTVTSVLEGLWATEEIWLLLPIYSGAISSDKGVSQMERITQGRVCRTARGGQLGNPLILHVGDTKLKAWQLAVTMRSAGSRIYTEDKADKI